VPSLRTTPQQPVLSGPPCAASRQLRGGVPCNACMTINNHVVRCERMLRQVSERDCAVPGRPHGAGRSGHGIADQAMRARVVSDRGPRAGGRTVNKVVLAYRAGWIRRSPVPGCAEQHGVEVITLTSIDSAAARSEETWRHAPVSAGPARYVVDGRDRFVRQFRVAEPAGQRALPGRFYPLPRRSPPLIAQLLVEVADRERASAVGARMHRQGQRPGSASTSPARPGPQAGGHRGPCAWAWALPRAGDRVRVQRGIEVPSHGPRRTPSTSPVGSILRDGHPRGPLGHAAAGGLRMERSIPGRPRTSRPR